MAVMPEGYRGGEQTAARGKDVNDFLCHRWGFPFGAATAKSRSGELPVFSFTDSPSCKLLLIYVNIKAVR